jgi:phosphocarrier protein HPr
VISKQYTILSPLGLHARPAAALIRLVKGFKSAVSLQKGDKTIRLNSMLNILTLTIKNGDSITVITANNRTLNIDENHDHQN